MERAGDPLRRRRRRPPVSVSIEAGARPPGADRTQPHDGAEGITVNRRQRHEGGTILGWNPEEQVRPRRRRDPGRRRGGWRDLHVVAFAAHPVVIGPDVPGGFVRLRRPAARARAGWTGGECVFLQGCAGNIVPFESFHTERGPERMFGERLALAALRARASAGSTPTAPEQMPFASAIPMAIWRHVETGQQDVTLAAAERQVDLPLLEPPTLEEIRTLRAELEQRVVDLKAAGEPRTAWNPSCSTSAGRGRSSERVADGTVERSVEAPVQALRIGARASRPGRREPFCELGLEVKERSTAPFPVTLGYSNDLVGYCRRAPEYPFGGYEPVVAQRHFGKPAPFAPRPASTRPALARAHRGALRLRADG